MAGLVTAGAIAVGTAHTTGRDFGRYAPESSKTVILPENRTYSGLKRAFSATGATSMMRVLPPRAADSGKRTSVICGSLLDQQNPGIYSFNLTDNSLTPLAVTSDLFANGNGFVYDNTYYSFFIEDFNGMPFVSVYEYDITNWDLKDSSYSYYQDTPMDLDTDPLSGKVYGCFPKTSSVNATTYVWAQYNPSSLTRMAICEYDKPMLAVACDATGQYYGIDSDADVYSINKLTGEKTFIGNTGISLSPNRQSAAFDLKYGQMYLSAELADYSSAIYEVNTTTGAATLVCDMPDDQILAGIYVPVPEAEFGAPGEVTSLTLGFDKDSTSGTISFTMPTQTYGAQPLTGILDYTVTIDGAVTDTGSKEAGSQVSIDKQVEAGMHTVSVYATNGEGDGPSCSVSQYIGPDTPKEVTNLSAVKSETGEIEISWDAPDGTVNGGWYDSSALTYTIIRLPDEKTIAKNQTGLKATDIIDSDILTGWQYQVTATSNGVSGVAAVSNGIVTGTYAEVPWESDFTDDTMWQAYTVINVHGDRYTWTHYAASDWRTGAYCDYDFTNPKDDWLITPPIELKEGYSYKLEFMTSTKRARPETLEVCMGSEPTVEGMTGTIMEPTTFTSDDYSKTDIELVHEYSIAPDADGKYYFGFHAMSEPQMSSLILKYIKITPIGVTAAPAAPENLTVIPGSEGALEATVTFNAPSVTQKGEKLIELTKAEVYVNGELKEEITTIEPGEEKTVTVPTLQGDNEIMVRTYNDKGQGLESKATVYTGVVVPGVVTNLKAKIDGDKVSLTWDAPQAGEDGGYVNPGKLTYMIMRNDQTFMAYSHEGTEFTDDLSDFSINGQRIVSYVVYPKNEAGTGYGVYSNGIVLGDGVYTLPFRESFPNGNATTSPWGISSTTETGWFLTRNGNTVYAYDGDNGQAMFNPKGPGESSMIYTGRFNLNKTANPVFSLMYWNDGESSNRIEVLWTENYSDFHQLAEISFNDANKEIGWTELKISLGELKGKDKFALALNGISGESGWEYNQFIDLLQVYDDLDYNLEMIEFDAPGNISFGNEGTFAGFISNRGNKAADGFSISILCNGEKVAEIPGGTVEPRASFTYSVQIKPKYEHAPSSQYQAVINWDKDENISDNASEERTVLITVNEFPSAQNLNGTRDDSQNVVLSWSEPEPGTAPAVTEDSFENHIAFITEDIEPWKLVDIDGENGTYGITYGGKPVEFLNATYPMAWIVFNPSKCGMDQATIGIDALMPHSGEQYLASFQDNDGLSDDWLISPELSGDRQTVSFWVRTPIPNNGFETFEVYYSMTGNEISDFVKLDGVKEEAFINWEEIAVSLPEGSRYFAIRHTSANKFLLAVDDIRYIAKGARMEALEVKGYTIYRDGDVLAKVDAGKTTYTDSSASATRHSYAVTVNYAQGESGYSNTVTVEPSAVENLIDKTPRATGINGAIRISNASGQNVIVSTSDGRIAAQGNVVSDQESIPAAAGVYIVTIGNRSFKVMVK